MLGLLLYVKEKWQLANGYELWATSLYSKLYPTKDFIPSKRTIVNSLHEAYNSPFTIHTQLPSLSDAQSQCIYIVEYFEWGIDGTLDAHDVIPTRVILDLFLGSNQMSEPT